MYIKPKVSKAAFIISFWWTKKAKTERKRMKIFKDMHDNKINRTTKISYKEILSFWK